MKQRDLIDEWCLEWVRWCDTRKFYIRPASKNMLARMQPSKSGEEPNARNHPDMAYFNMAIQTLADMPLWRQKFEAFYTFYCGDARPAKTIAFDMKIGRRTYYDRVASFGKEAFSMSQTIKRVSEATANGEA